MSPSDLSSWVECNLESTLDQEKLDENLASEAQAPKRTLDRGVQGLMPLKLPNFLNQDG